MKVVDMLGCGLPVLALDFSCLDELVINGRNGLTFSDAAGLERGLEAVLADFPRSDNWLRRNLEQSTAFPSAEDDIPALATESSSMLRVASASGSADGSGLNDLVAPLTPGTPSFSMLASPTLPHFSAVSDKDAATQATLSEAAKLRSKRARNDTWRGNWKSVVRPLLLYDEHPQGEADTGPARRQRGFSGSSGWLQPHGHRRRRQWLSLGQSRAVKVRTSEEDERAQLALQQQSQPTRPTSQDGAGGSDNGDGDDTLRDEEDERRTSGISESAGDQEARQRLRRRKRSEGGHSTADRLGMTAPAELAVGAEADDEHASWQKVDIPHIHVSRAADANPL